MNSELLLKSGKSLLPHGGVVLGFVALTVLYFYPVFFQNKRLYQGDIAQYARSVQQMKKQEAKTGEHMLWNQNIFSGMPAYLGGLDWGNTYVGHLKALLSLQFNHPTWIIFSALLWTYVLLLAWGLRIPYALLGACIFTYASYMTVGIVAGHNARVGAMAYVPMILAGFTYRIQKLLALRAAAVCAAGVALQFSTNHVQITYYTLFISLFFVVGEGIIALQKGGRSKKIYLLRSAALIVAALIGFSTYAGQFWSLYNYAKHTIRGERMLTPHVTESKEGLDKGYAFEYSNAPLESMTLLVPNFYGGQMKEPLGAKSHTAQALRRHNQPRQYLQYAFTYHGKQPITTPYYVGAVACLLLVFAFLVLRGRERYGWLALLMFAIFLTWGKNFALLNYSLFDYLPGYNKFRSPTFATLIIVLVVAVVGPLGLSKAFHEGFSQKIRKKFWQTCVGLSSLLVLIFLLAPLGNYSAGIDTRLTESGLPNWFIEALHKDRLALLRKDTLRGLLFILLAGSVLYAMFTQKINRILGWGLLLSLTWIDLWLINDRYIDPSFFAAPHQVYDAPASAANHYVSTDTSLHYRVYPLNNPFNDNTASSFHASVGGYHPAKLRRYQDIIEHGLSTEREVLIAQIREKKLDLAQLHFSNMLNVKYFMLGNEKKDVLINDQRCGAAWFASKLVTVYSADEEIEALKKVKHCAEITLDISEFTMPHLATTDKKQSNTYASHAQSPTLHHRK